MKFRIVKNQCISLSIFSIMILGCGSNLNTDSYVDENLLKSLNKSMEVYNKQVLRFRNEFRSAENVPDIKFFLFGMGNRSKWLYKDGKLINAISGDLYKEWQITEELIIPNEYAVLLKTESGEDILIQEDESSVSILNNKETFQIDGTQIPVNLPEFENKSYS